jgi:hypothetical protein
VPGGGELKILMASRGVVPIERGCGGSEVVVYESVKSRGYAFQVELTYRALQQGFRVKEVPIVFRDRRVGESKMTSRIVLEGALAVPRLRRQLQADRHEQLGPEARGLPRIDVDPVVGGRRENEVVSTVARQDAGDVVLDP